MRCPACHTPNPPGADACRACELPLTHLDEPAPYDRVERGLMTDPVTALGVRPATVVSADAVLADAVRAMIGGNTGAVLVTGPSGELVGVLTERDILTKAAGREGFDALPVADLMTRHPEAVGPADTVAFALGMMDAGGYRHLPVVDGGRPVGVVSVRDVLRYVTRLSQNA